MDEINIKAILFDMDGVVVDSEKVHLQAMGITLERHGIAYTQAFLNEYVGRSDESFFAFVYENMDRRHTVEALVAEKNAIFESLLSEIAYVDGFPDFIKRVKRMNLKTGLVTSSSLFTVRKFDKLFHLTSFFDTVVTEEDTEKHKPFPDPYLLAIDRLALVPSQTLIIEDSINGIIAGKAAGCRVAGLTTSFDADTLKKAGADYAITHFSSLSIKQQD